VEGPEQPAATPREPWFWLVVGAALAVAGTVAFSPRPDFDELTVASDAVRLLHGQVIYRDFFEFIGPLTSWVGAAIVAMAGPSIVALRLATAAVIAATAGLFYHLGRRLALPPPIATLPALALVVGAFPLDPFFSHHWLALLAMAVALAGALAGSTRGWGVAGFGAGLAALAVQSDGLALAGALAVWLALDAWLGRAPAWRRAAGLALGLALALLPALAYLAAVHALGAAWADVVRWPLAHYRQPGNPNDVTYLMDLPDLFATNQPGFRRWAYYAGGARALALELLPLAAVLVTGARLLDALAVRPWPPATARLVLVGGPGAALLLAAMRGRCDQIHLAFLAPMTWLVLLAALEGVRRCLAGPGQAIAPCLPHAVLVAVLAGSTALAATTPSLRPRGGGADRTCLEGPALTYLRAHGGPEAGVAAWPHGGLYYFYGMRPAVRHAVIFPPEAGYNSAEEWQAFWQDVAAHRPRWVVYSIPKGPVGRTPTPPPVPGYRYRVQLPVFQDLPDHGIRMYQSYLFELDRPGGT
jgi:hypothetical protein